MSEEQSNGNGSVEFKTPLFSARLGGKDFQLRDLILIATFVGVCIIGTGGYQLMSGIKEMASAQRDQASAQREMNCLISLPQEKREQEYRSEYGLCKRISR